MYFRSSIIRGMVALRCVTLRYVVLRQQTSRDHLARPVRGGSLRAVPVDAIASAFVHGAIELGRLRPPAESGRPIKDELPVAHHGQATPDEARRF